MESTARVSENLFYLFADLSQVREKDLLMTVFIKRMGEIFCPAEFVFKDRVEKGSNVFELKGEVKHWGFLEIVEGPGPSEVTLGYLQKAVNLFVFLLDGIASKSDRVSEQGFKPRQTLSDAHSDHNEDVEKLGVSFKSGGFSFGNHPEMEGRSELESYFLLFEKMSQGVVFLSPEGKITSVNPSGIKILGIENQEVIGGMPLKGGWKFLDRNRNEIDWNDLPAMVAIREKRSIKQEVIGVFNPLKDDFRWLLLDAVPLFTKNDEVPFQVYTCFTDYTKQKKTEDELLLLSHSVEQSPASVVITDSAGQIEYVNPTFSKVTGYTFDEVKGENPRVLKSGKNPQSLYDSLWETIVGGENWTGELINKKKNGDHYWEQLIVSPIIGENGVISHFVAIREDISEKKKMIDNLVIAKEQAEKSDRLKTAFLANISHEIRTPMNGILGFLELLRNPELNDEVKDQYIDIVNKSGDRLLRTINDLVEISKIESGQVEIEISQVYLPEIMEYYLEFFRPQAFKKHLGINIACQIEDPDALIQTDRSKIEVTLSNLISNAIKFTEIGKIEFGNYITGDTLVFFVRDSGVGISPDYMDIVFDRFVQADLNMTRPYQGTGLGLSIVKGYIEILKGEIWVESQEGTGSTFYFSIPYNPVKP